MNVYTGILAAGFFLGTSFFSSSYAAPEAKAVIVNTKGDAVGSAFLRQKGEGVKIQIKVKGISQGPHGIHIHEVGKCEGPDFKTAGSHFNPHGKQHGLNNPHGSHSGDLPNLIANKKGKAEAKVLARGVNLQEGAIGSLFNSEGTALVIHAGPDDDVTDPSGNSGGRIACGVIEKV